MKHKFLLLSLLVASFVLPSKVSAETPKKEYQRIVSLLPSVTEIIYALNAQDKLIGVTSYCQYPPEAQKKRIVGGLLDANYEILYDLNPDLVILEVNSSQANDTIKKMGIETLLMETRSIPEILRSITMLGSLLGREKEGRAIVQDLESTIQTIQTKTANLKKPKVLITYLRPIGEGTIRDVFVAGNFTYFEDLINITGGENAYRGSQQITSPVLSAEGILRLNPDIIIELMSNTLEAKYSPEIIKKDWDMLPQLDAYQNKHIYILQQPYISIPGPRLGRALLDIAAIIHPEIDWSKP